MADDEIIMVRGCKSRAACSVLLRGPNDYMLDEMDRSLHDALCIVKRVLESGKVVAGVPWFRAWCSGSGDQGVGLLLPGKMPPRRQGKKESYKVPAACMHWGVLCA